MKKEEFYELLGDIDDNAVEAAGNTPVKKPPLKLIITSAAAVICVGFIVSIGVMMLNNNQKPIESIPVATVEETTQSTTAATVAPTTAKATEPAATEAPKPTEAPNPTEAPAVTESSDTSESSETPENPDDNGDNPRGDGAQAYGDVRVYYVKNDKLYYDTSRLPLDPQEIFKDWKQKNNIGSEVVLKKVWIDSNSQQSVDENGVGHGTMGDTFYLTITVSKNLSNYYSRTPEELLTESLKKTLSEHGSDDDSNNKYEEVYLILD